MSHQSVTPALLPAFGAPFHGGFFGGRISSHEGLKVYGIAWAPRLQGERSGAWMRRSADVPGATSCVHSYDNTVAMAQAGSELAQWALDLEIDGTKGWCLPARDVLELGYRHLKPTAETNWASFRDGDNPSALPAGYPYTNAYPLQTTAEAFREGGAEAFETDIYWASTQYSAGSAWYQYFSHGLQSNTDKGAEFRARACRLILLNP